MEMFQIKVPWCQLNDKLNGNYTHSSSSENLSSTFAATSAFLVFVTFFTGAGFSSGSYTSP